MYNSTRCQHLVQNDKLVSIYILIQLRNFLYFFIVLNLNKTEKKQAADPGKKTQQYNK